MLMICITVIKYVSLPKQLELNNNVLIMETQRKAIIHLMEYTLPNYYKLTQVERELVCKVGLTQIDTLGESYEWDNLSILTDDELYKLHDICVDSWTRK